MNKQKNKVNHLNQKPEKRVIKFTDRLAVTIIILLVLFGSLTPVFKALSYVPYLGSYFYEMGRVLPRLRYQFFMISEVDCIGYYSYLRSLVVDHDLDFENDFTLFGWPRRAKEKTSMGLTTNPWSVGPAIHWSPAFLVAHGLSIFLDSQGIPVPTNGISYIYDFFIVITSMGYGLIGIIFIYYFLRFFFSSFISCLSVLFLFYASALIFYQFHEPTMSHILTVFAVSGFVYFWYRNWMEKTYRDWSLLGIWGGLIILIRPQDIFFLAFPVLAELIAISIKEKKINFSFLLGPFLLFLVAFLCFIPQMLAWKVLYGSFLTIPQGSGFMQWFNPQILPLLFSTRHGLITYTPIISFALLGLFLFKRGEKNQKMLFWVFLAVFLCELYVNSAASDWGAGWAFGARRFLSCSIIFAWGLGNLLQLFWKNKKFLYVTLGIFSFLIIFNLLFYFQWAYGLISRGDPLTWQQYFNGKIDAFWLWLKVMDQLFSIIFS